MRVMSDIRFAGLWSLLGLAVGLFAFSMSYWYGSGPFPGYKVLVGPGILTLRMFSEEIDFWPKLSLMMAGQYIIYFVCLILSKKLYGAIYKND